MRQLILDLLPEAPPSFDNYVGGGNAETIAQKQFPAADILDRNLRKHMIRRSGYGLIKRCLQQMLRRSSRLLRALPQLRKCLLI